MTTGRLTEHERALEAALFANGDPADLKTLATVINCDQRDVAKLLDNLANKYVASNSGLRIVIFNNMYQLCSAPECASYVKTLNKTQTVKSLTTPLLETLAIIAYSQPATKSHIESIRGVSSDHAVNKLIDYGLVEELGRSDLPGRPLLFGTTPDFLKKFNLKNLEMLPDVDSLAEKIE